MPVAPATGTATCDECGELTINVGGSSPYGTIYLTDSTTTGSFYSNSTCTTAYPTVVADGQVITSPGIAGAASVNVWYENSAASAPELMACTVYTTGFLGITTPEQACELDQAGGTALLTTQNENIYSPAHQLAWSVLPGNGAPGGPLAPQPAVVVQDSGGHTVTASAASILLTLSTNPAGGGGTLTCKGGNPINATSGIAQFSGCSVSPAFSGEYCLTASSTGLTSTPAACFYVSNPADPNKSSVISSVVPPNTVLDNGAATATITVTLLDSSGSPVAGKTVTLSRAPAPAQPFLLAASAESRMRMALSPSR